MPIVYMQIDKQTVEIGGNLALFDLTTAEYVLHCMPIVYMRIDKHRELREGQPLHCLIRRQQSVTFYANCLHADRQTQRAERGAALAVFDQTTAEYLLHAIPIV